MSLTAADETTGSTILATPDGPRRARCRDCDDVMVARLGDVVVHHWAHRADPDRECSMESAGETEWHLSWKARCTDPARVEYAVPSIGRRTDTMTPYWYAVEFQHSPMDVREVEAREKSWTKDGTRRLVWVFDALEAYAENRLMVYRPPDDAGRTHWRLRWAWAKKHVLATRAATFLHITPEELVLVGGWYRDRSPVYGYGWRLSVDEFADHVLNGAHPPRLPAYRQRLDPASWDSPPAATEQAQPRRVGENGDHGPEYDESLGERIAFAQQFHAEAAQRAAQTVPNLADYWLGRSPATADPDPESDLCHCADLEPDPAAQLAQNLLGATPLGHRHR